MHATQFPTVLMPPQLPPDTEDIAALAYQFYMNGGACGDTRLDDWLCAEYILTNLHAVQELEIRESGTLSQSRPNISRPETCKRAPAGAKSSPPKSSGRVIVPQKEPIPQPLAMAVSAPMDPADFGRLDFDRFEEVAIDNNQKAEPARVLAGRALALAEDPRGERWRGINE